jgi:Tfp pilus assembly protein PilX
MLTRKASSRRERGSALFIAVMMLTLMGFLGLAALDRVTRDEQVAGYQNRARTAFYAAEAGIAEGRRIVRFVVEAQTDLPNFPTQAVPRTLGDSVLFDREGGNLPRYFGDPNDALASERCGVAAATAICFAKKGVSGGAGLGMNLHVGQATIDEALWHIGVVGESPDGSRSRVSVLESKVMTLGGY